MSRRTPASPTTGTSRPPRPVAGNNPSSSRRSVPSTGSIYNYNIRVCFQLTTFESSVEYMASPRKTISLLGDYILSDTSRSLKVLHYGHEIENPSRGFLAIVWADPEHHIVSDQYNHLLSRALARRSPPSLDEIWLDAESYLWGVFSAPAVSVQIFRLKRLNDVERVIPMIADWTSRSRTCEGYRDHWFNTTINVNDDEFIVVTGWDSIEAQWNARSGGDYASGLQRIQQYATVDARTVKMTRYSRFT